MVLPKQLRTTKLARKGERIFGLDLVVRLECITCGVLKRDRGKEVMGGFSVDGGYLYAVVYVSPSNFRL